MTVLADKTGDQPSLERAVSREAATPDQMLMTTGTHTGGVPFQNVILNEPARERYGWDVPVTAMEVFVGTVQGYRYEG